MVQNSLRGEQRCGRWVEVLEYSFIEANNPFLFFNTDNGIKVLEHHIQ